LPGIVGKGKIHRHFRAAARREKSENCSLGKMRCLLTSDEHAADISADLSLKIETTETKFGG